MLNNFTEIRDTLNPDIVLFRWDANDEEKGQFYAIDVYSPNIEECEKDPDGHAFPEDEIIAIESAMGYSLRSFSSYEDIEFIPPVPRDSGDIKRILTNNLKAIKDSGYPLQIGFQFDANPPNEASNKTLTEVLLWCCENQVKVMVSTAYTISTDLRNIFTKMMGQYSGVAVELRIHHRYGIGVPDIAQINMISFRLHTYAMDTPIYLCYSGIGRHSTLDVQWFYDAMVKGGPEVERCMDGGQRQMQPFATHLIRGHRVMVPNPPIVPSRYIELLLEERRLSVDYSFDKVDEKEGYYPNEDSAQSILLQLLKRGEICDVINGSSRLEKLGQRVFRNKQYFKKQGRRERPMDVQRWEGLRPNPVAMGMDIGGPEEEGMPLRARPLR